MNIFQLETFLKIAETKNFTTAGNILGYAQSTVTAQIKGLEDELGCLLFERLGKSIVLTPEGQKLCGYAQKMLQLKREIFFGSSAVKGAFRRHKAWRLRILVLRHLA
ncbi:MAG: LysR family transcriptional regulator [Treponema sp.]|nr:LysR family transcriptional regulator [Treponema sp.]